jgi:aminoglycoside phosphotransferase (APT) family kinase protein
MRPDEYAAIELWWDRFLADPLLDDFTAVLCHGDLWYENVLVKPDGLVSGVVDWEAVAVDDPVQDFVPLLYLGEVFTADVRAAYEEAGGRLGFSSAHRLRQLSALREFGGVQHAARHDDMAELADSVEKLRRGPILRYKTGS